MATIITKNSSTASSVPAAGSLQQGELAVNVTDKKLYTKDSSAAVVKLVGSLGNQEANAVAITGGTINGTAIGGTTPAAAAFTTASASGGFTGNLTGNASTVTNGVYTTGSYADPAWITSLAGSKITGNISGNAANVTGTVAIANGGTGLTALGTGVQTALGQTVTGSGGIVLAASPSLTTPNLGTPSAVTLTNATGLPVSTGISGLGTNVATALGVSVGSVGSVVVNGGALGTPSSGTLTNATGLPLSTGVTGTLAVANGGTGITAFGSGVATALGVNVGSAGAFVVNGGALGTPSSGTVTNLTGTASININGTVGATTPNTGSFTTLTTSSTVTINGGTANGVAYLNGSKVLTTGSALTFDGANLGVGTSSPIRKLSVSNSGAEGLEIGPGSINGDTSGAVTSVYYNRSSSAYVNAIENANSFIYQTSGTEQMRLTSTGLGIGTSSPAGKLHVSGQTRIADSANAANYILIGSGANAPRGGNALTAQTGSLVFATESANPMIFVTNAAEAARLDSSGNLGLGVTPSAWGSVSRAMQFQNGVSIFSNSSGLGGLGNNVYSNPGTADYYIATGFATRYYQFNGTHVWNTAASGNAGDTISFTQAMTLDASGNWMTGTTTAIGRATVVGGSSQLAFHDGNGSNTNYGLLNYGGSSGELTLNANSTGGNTLIRFLTSSGGSNAERARITSGGDLLLGTTSATPANANGVIAFGGTDAGIIYLQRQTGTDQLRFYTGGNRLGYVNTASSILTLGTANFPLVFATNDTERARITSGGDLLVGMTNTTPSNALGFAVNNSNAGISYTQIQHASGTASGASYEVFYYNASPIGSITQNGTTAVAYNTSSDYRLKDNPQPLTNSGAFIDALKPKTWNWKADGSKGVGFIAHEVQEVSPGSVVGEKDGEQMQAMEYGSAEFIANIIAEIQSLRARVAQLEAK